jgi:hypothetical protein
MALVQKYLLIIVQKYLENIRKAELERAVITVQVDGASTKVLAYHSTKVLGEHQKGGIGACCYHCSGGWRDWLNSTKVLAYHSTKLLAY